MWPAVFEKENVGIHNGKTYGLWSTYLTFCAFKIGPLFLRILQVNRLMLASNWAK